MAGESPDKSEQRKSSGETAPGERDPRLAVASVPRGPEPGTESGSAEGDARLRAAVAAWVQSADDAEERSEAETRMMPEAVPAQAGEREGGDAKAAGDDGSDAADGSGGDDEADAGDGASDEPKADQATAVFRTPVKAEETAAGEENAAGADEPEAPAPDQATAVFRTLPTREKAGEAPAVDQATAVFRAPAKPEEGEQSEKGEESGARDGAVASASADAASAEAPEAPEASDEPASAPESDKATAVFRTTGAPKGDQATAMFRAVRPEDADAEKADAKDGSGPAAEDDGGTGEDAPGTDAKSGQDRGSKSGPESGTSGTEEAEGDDKAAPSWAAKDSRALDNPTTALKLPAPSPAPKSEVKGGAAAGSTPVTEPVAESGSGRKPESDAERTSQFVPLRSDDVRTTASPQAKPAPTGKTTGKTTDKTTGESTGTPAAKATGAPAGKPAPKPAERPAERTATSAAPVVPAAGAPGAASLGEAERTRQQPMPPRPPLDLLAELTNTPPPAQTPVRTVVRRVKIWTPLILLVLIVFAVVQMVRPLPPPTLKLTAAAEQTFEGGELKLPWPGEGAAAVDVDGIGSMGRSGAANKPTPTASTAKVMTAYIILRDHPLKGQEPGPSMKIEKVTEVEGVKNVDESRVAAKEGVSYTQREMLLMMMLPSANNIARQLARWDAGSEAAFVKKMNATAKELGMTNSTYTDPSGFKSSTVSTPVDQVKLAKKAMENEVFRYVVSQPNFQMHDLPTRMENGNARNLLRPDAHFSGIKTGSSTPAGGNLIWAANKEVDGKNRRIVGAVMGMQEGSTPSDKLSKALDAAYELVKAAEGGLTSKVLVKKGQVVGYVDDGLGGRTPVVATQDLKALGWSGVKVKLDLADGGKALAHTAAEGTVVGKVSTGSGTGEISVPVAVQQDLVEPGTMAKLTRVG
ncbi:D-alanyl-D-alanine carboxypeptidase [Streptomyces sp. NPDC001941]|uniref:D-alanyl-D-alanine carboxypeptidase n=1 Tax=Streptomyces sp. NPDC001941 TaxID=3154659 RepID=UPI00332AB761